MDESYCELGSRSPVLCRPMQRLNSTEISDSQVNLEKIHSRLLEYLKKKVNIPRNELKLYLEQLQKVNPDDHRNRWILMKTKGLLNYILKKRTDFQYSIVKGEITIFEKSASQPTSSLNKINESLIFENQIATHNSFNLPSNLLTNNNFVSEELSNHKLDVCNVKVDYCPSNQELDICNMAMNNGSSDLFGDNLGTLHSISQENFQILKELTDNTGIDENVFKFPTNNKINKALELHYTLEKQYTSLCSSAAPSDIFNDPIFISNNDHPESVNMNKNFLDDLSINNEQLQKDFKIAFDQTEQWMAEIYDKLTALDTNDSQMNNCSSNRKKEDTEMLNETSSTCSNLPLKPYYSEENFKIIREVCSEFKKTVEKNLKPKKLKILRDLLNSSDSDFLSSS